MRFSTYASVLLFAAAAFGLYLVKYAVQDVAEDLTVLEAELQQERENLTMLEAEWAYLNRPQRLRQLSSKYLDMVSMSGERVVVLDVLPGADQHFAWESHATEGYITPVSSR